MRTIRALGLLSGGLDSMLAARMLIDQGLEVVGLHLESPTACRSDVRAIARELGIRLEVRAKGEEYVRLLRHPRFGYGRNMNPCIDCRVFMFRLGRSYLEEFDAHFLFTGEVLGQRPMSQMRSSIELIDRVAELQGWILRPLSARVLPETEPERRGWVDRARLLGLRGRARRAQIELLRRYGLRSRPSPAGGCLLTDPGFSTRLRDLFENAPAEAPLTDEIALLRVGRHFRVRPDLKIVLGRDATENLRLRHFERPDRRVVEPEGFAGPTALVCGEDVAGGIPVAARLIARFARPADDAGRAEEGTERRVRWREEGRWVSAPVPSGRLESSPLPV
jgi:hypothetical protein